MKNLAAVVVLAVMPFAPVLAQGWVVDPSFGVGTGAEDPIVVTNVEQQPNGTLLVGGWFELFDGVPRAGLVKLSSSGEIDLSFNAGITGSPARVDLVLRMPDGRIIVGGQFDAVVGEPRNGLARLMPTGGLDVGLAPETSGWVWAADVTSTNDLFIGGNLFDLNLGFSEMSVVDEMGATVAQPAMGMGDVIRTQPDDHVLVGSRDAPFVLRLMPDGSTDATFTSGFGAGTQDIHDMVLQPDGRVLVCGDFQTVDGTSRSMIARLNADGSLDTAFDPGTGFNGDAEVLLLLADGDVLVAGDFTTYNGVALEGGLVRLGPGGVLLASYPASGIQDMVMQPSGKLVVVGFQLSYEGLGYPGILRLMPDIGTGMQQDVERTVSAYPNPARDVVVVQRGGSSTCQWSVLDAMGRVVGSGVEAAQQVRLPLNGLAPGAYALRIVDEMGMQVARFIKE